MQVKMQQDNSTFFHAILTISCWIIMKIFAFVGFITLAQFASICVVLSAMWTMVANSGKAIENIERFHEWYKQFKKK